MAVSRAADIELSETVQLPESHAIGWVRTHLVAKEQHGWDGKLDEAAWGVPSLAQPHVRRWDWNIADEQWRTAVTEHGAGTPQECRFDLWLPDGVAVIRGVVAISGHGSGVTLFKHPELRQIARDLRLGLFMFVGDPVQRGFWPKRLLGEKLRAFGARCGHPELGHAPLFLYGHSNGTGFSAVHAAADPARVWAWVSMRPGITHQVFQPAAAGVPGLVIFGEDDQFLTRPSREENLAVVPLMRKKHAAVWNMAVEPKTGHGPGEKTWPLVFSFLRHTFAARVPADLDPAAGPVQLTRLDPEGGWRGGTWSLSKGGYQELSIAPAADFTGDAATASWLVNEAYAADWRKFQATGDLRTASATAPPRTSAAPSVAAESTAHPRPNVVFLLVDDLGWGDCGFSGGTEIKTPHIDALAKAGAVLEAHYVQPVCSPTRSCLMTGRYPTRTGVYGIVRPHSAWGLPLAERTLADELRAAGYATAICGKWHLGEFKPEYLPLARGFDHHYGHYFGMIDYFTHTRGGDRDWHRDGKPLAEPGYSTELLATEACRVIATRDRNEPLFLYVPFNGVHTPLQVPPRYLEPYGQLTGGRQVLAGMLAAVDEGVGRIVAALDAAGMRDDTLIVFSSDNGGQAPGTNGPLRDFKGSLYEGGIRGAAFASWPGRIPAGQRIREPVHIVDWFPTLVGLAGVKTDPARPLDGVDIWPVLTARGKSTHAEILVASGPGTAALRAGDWKLIVGEGLEPELYDLAADGSERHDLAATEPARLAALQQRMARALAGAVQPGNAGLGEREPTRRTRRATAR
jgi:arylsulfatase A-like enzyme